MTAIAVNRHYFAKIGMIPNRNSRFLYELCACKMSTGHPSKVAKRPIMSPGDESMVRDCTIDELRLCCL